MCLHSRAKWASNPHTRLQRLLKLPAGMKHIRQANSQSRAHSASRQQQNVNSAAYDKDDIACQCKNGKTSGESSDLMDSQVAEEASCRDDAASRVKANEGFTEEQGVYHGLHDIRKAWAVIERKMTGLPRKQREHLEQSDCRTFGEAILKLISENESWSSPTYSTALHRLARLRIYHGHFVQPCKYVFEILLGRAADMSRSQTPRDLATMMWSLAKISGLETLEAREFVPIKSGELDHRLPGRADDATLDSLPQLTASPAEDAVDEGADFEGAFEGQLESMAADKEEQEPYLRRPQRALQHTLPSMELMEKPHMLHRRHSIKEYYSHFGVKKAGSLAEPAISHHSVSTESSVDGPSDDTQPYISDTFRGKLDYIARSWIDKDEERQTSHSDALILWSFATLGYNPIQGQVFKAVQKRMIINADQLSTIDLSNIYWSHGHLKVQMPEDVQNALSRQLISLAEKRQLQVITIPPILQACRILKLRETNKIFRVLLAYIFKQPNRQPVNKLTPKALTSLLNSVERAKQPFSYACKQEWAKQCLYRLDEFELKDLIAILEACRKMKMSPQKGQFLEKVYTRRPELQIVAENRRGRLALPKRRKGPPRIVS